MSVRDYIHPSWREAWQKIREGFTPSDDDEPYADDTLSDRVPGQRLNYTQIVGSEETLIHDGFYLYGPTGRTPVTGDTYTDEDGQKWRISRVEMYQKSRGGSWDKHARIWVERVA